MVRHDDCDDEGSDVQGLGNKRAAADNGFGDNGTGS